MGTKTKRQLSITAVNATVTIVAGNLTTGSYYGGYSGDGGPATLAHLHYPLDVAVGVKGNIYIADTFNNVIRMVNGVTGIITTVAGNLTIGSIVSVGLSNSGGYSGDGGPEIGRASCRERVLMSV